MHERNAIDIQGVPVGMLCRGMLLHSFMIVFVSVSEIDASCRTE